MTKHVGQNLWTVRGCRTDCWIFSNGLQEVFVGVGSISIREEVNEFRLRKDGLNVFDILWICIKIWLDGIDSFIVKCADRVLSQESDLVSDGFRAILATDGARGTT